MSNWIRNFRICFINTSYKKFVYTAKFVTKDGSVDCYPGPVQYFFTHTVDLPDGPSEHYLAYVRWYNHTDSRYYFSVDDDEQTCNVKLWQSSFYSKSCDCIIPVHHIL